MKRGFARTLWGFYGDERPLYRCRGNMDADLELQLLSKYEPTIDITTYVFGEENFKQLVDKGLKCKLIDKRPMVWDGATQMFRHKLEVFKYAIEDYDEFVFLDLDCILIQPLPTNFWEKHYEKASIQGSLMQYKRRKMKFWRKTNQGANPCACYIYIREKKIPEELIQTWEAIGKPLSEEVVIAKYMDDMIGGWQGLDKYYELFEPHFFSVSQRIIYTNPKPDPQCFYHFHESKSVRNILNAIKSGKKPEWCK